ncbi:MAG: anaerobic selenocysteine-containing dehydrogenase [Acidimicrobiales bacterium]|jgi:anaerobic selenocysteine-containing dehydrogenase
MEARSAPTKGFRTVIGACPLDCPDTCSWVVTVDDDGKAVKLRGNPEHPFTQGELCKKVNPWLTNAADPSRLLHPLRRVGPKGSAQFEQINWDEALNEMAQRFSKIIDRSGGAAIWPYVGTGNLGWLQGSNGRGRIWNRMGASEHHLSICSVSGHAGFSLTSGTGAGMDPEDFANAGLVLVWASNTLTTNRHLWPFIEEARAKGAKLVVVDPTRTRTADQADTHIAPRLGTDGALALGVCNAIVSGGGADPEFLEARCLGADEFLASLDEWTLDRTASITGVSAAEITGLAQAIIDAPPLAMRIGHGIQRQANGGQAMRVASCIPAIVGAYGRRGGGALYSSSGSGKGYNVAKARSAHLGDRPRLLGMTNLGFNLTELDDPPVDALVVYGANPMVSNPGRNLVQTGLERDDLFTVVVDIYPTETAAFADLVLPSTMQHEQFEVNDAYNHAYVNWNEPAVEAPGECLPHTEIWRRLAAVMGYTEPELFASDLEIAADLFDAPAFTQANVTVDSLREHGFLRHPTSQPKEGLFAAGFPTPSGRFEFASERAEADGYGRLPNYRPPLEAASGKPGDGTLALVAAASDFHVNSVFAATDHTLRRTTVPPLVLHPTDATSRGLSTGDTVLIGNERGSFEAVLEISDRTLAGVAITTKGWWRHGINDTVLEQDSDMAGGAIFHDNRVTVARR